MKCPYCDSLMDHVYKDKDYFICRGGGRLLTKESGECIYKDDLLTESEINKIIVALIDLDMDD